MKKNLKKISRNFFSKRFFEIFWNFFWKWIWNFFIQSLVGKFAFKNIFWDLRFWNILKVFRTCFLTLTWEKIIFEILKSAPPIAPKKITECPRVIPSTPVVRPITPFFSKTNWKCFWKKCFEFFWKNSFFWKKKLGISLKILLWNRYENFLKDCEKIFSNNFFWN